MNEQRFWKPIEPGFASQGLYVHRISDRARGETKPCDYILCAGGDFWALECKLTVIKRTGEDWQPRQEDIFARFSDLRPSQQSALPAVEAAKGRALVGLGVYARRYGVTVRRAWVLLYGALQEYPILTFAELLRLKPFELIWQPGTGWLLPRIWLRSYGAS